MALKLVNQPFRRLLAETKGVLLTAVACSVMAMKQLTGQFDGKRMFTGWKTICNIYRNLRGQALANVAVGSAVSDGAVHCLHTGALTSLIDVSRQSGARPLVLNFGSCS